MAEFCYECFVKYIVPENEPVPELKDVKLSRYPELCEGCVEYKKVVVRLKRKFIRRHL